MTGVQTSRYAYANADYGVKGRTNTGHTAQEEFLRTQERNVGLTEGVEQTEGEAQTGGQEKAVSEMSYAEMTDYIQSRAREIYEKLQKGETEVKRQLGGSEFTDAQWEKLLARVDEAIQAMREEQEKEKAEREKKETGKTDKAEGTEESAGGSTLMKALEDLAEEIGKERRIVKAEPEDADAARAADAAAAIDGRGQEEKDDIDKLAEATVGTVLVGQTAEITAKATAKKVLYVTCITPEGISCKSSEQKLGDAPLWEIKFNGSDDYDKVMRLINRFDKDENLTFASREDFWENLLADNIDEEEFCRFYEGLREGGAGYLMGTADGADAPTEEQLSYLPYCMEKMNLRAESGIDREAQADAVKAAAMEKKAQNASEELLQNLPEAVREAWYAAAEKVGTDGLANGPDGKREYISQLMIERIVGRHEDYSTLLGDSARSAYQFAEQAVANLQRELARSADMSVQLRGYHEKEMEFYREFMKQMQTLP